MSASEAGQGRRTGPVLFFDGECGLCSRGVRWLLRHDRSGTIRFAPLQGETYARLAGRGQAPEAGPRGWQSAVLSDQRGVHVGSEAIGRALLAAGGWWSWVGRGSLLLPRALREAAYRFVARRRLGWFGGADACPLDRSAHAERFLP
ncbi:MAG: thiol-disulfide oxidoreductase DCC family protein [Phycisphaerales bacterium]